jgi:acetyltransferase
MDPELKKSLDRIFRPRSVAIAGASSRHDSPGTLFLRSLQDMGYEGKVYPINPRHREILGYTCHPDILSLPETVDLAILSVPPRAVPPLVKECAEKGVAGCIINTAGFSEKGTEEGKRLEKEILSSVRDGRPRLIGPNCMGVYSSRGKIALFAGMFPVQGSLAMISQSGSLASITFMTAMERGLYFDKIVSSGNELDLNCSHFLEYFAQDPSVDMVLAYLEEIREPRRFLSIAAGMRKRKPLVVLKGGITGAGERAAASHTAALGGRTEILEGAFRQAGIVPARDLEELLGFSAALHHLPRPSGNRVAVLSSPGGLGVNCADAVERWGMTLSPLTSETRKEFASFLPAEGTSFSNPVDLGFGAVTPGNYSRALHILDADPTVDIILAVGSAPASRKGDIGLIKGITDEIISSRPDIEKPLVVVLFPSSFVAPHAARLHAEGVPAYTTPTAACRALRVLIDYHHGASVTG